MLPVNRVWVNPFTPKTSDLDPDISHLPPSQLTQTLSLSIWLRRALQRPWGISSTETPLSALVSSTTSRQGLLSWKTHTVDSSFQEQCLTLVKLNFSFLLYFKTCHFGLLKCVFCYKKPEAKIVHSHQFSLYLELRRWLILLNRTTVL